MDNCTEDKKFIDMLQYTNKTPKDNKVKTIYDVYTSYKKKLEETFPYEYFIQNINEEITPNPFNLEAFAKCLGLEIIIDRLPLEISGEIEKTTIKINSMDLETRQTFTIAHEIGHYILEHGDIKEYRRKKDYYTKEDIKKEEDADYFAANLLLPSSIINKAVDIFKNARSLKNLSQTTISIKEELISKLQDTLKVSESAILKRLTELNHHIITII
jgi:hypothetical protein